MRGGLDDIASTPAWHAMEAGEVIRALGTGERGLSTIQAKERLASVGPNRIPSKPPPTLAMLFLRQVRNPVVYVLIVAGVLSILIGHFTDAVMICIVVVLNTLIGGYQEYGAERSARALQSLLKSRASVIRDAELIEVDAEEIVPGDLVWLESGNRVPADVRLTSTDAIEIDESLLTGESAPVPKSHAWRASPGVPAQDRGNVAYAGSMVARGRGEGVVVATGGGTEVGRLALDVMGGASGQPPLIIRLERLSRLIGAAVVLVTVLLGGVAVFVHGQNPGEVLIFAVALAVAAIPEGLPVAITVALSVGARRMAACHVIIRRLGAVEGLGSCTLIASDKTGTLTCNELTVRRVALADNREFEVSGSGFVPEGSVVGADALPAGDLALRELALGVALCNEGELRSRDGAWTWRGDPTDVALLSFARKLGVAREEARARLPQVAQIAFEPERRFAATFHRDADGARVYVKGAPERVLAMCELKDAALASIGERAHAMAGAGFRVLAVAGGAAREAQPVEPESLTFLGLVAMIDPLREGVREAVAACRTAGVRVAMVTGDHPVTALAIARELGLAADPGEVVTGAELATMTPEEARGAIARGRVFARVAPHQKLDIVRAAQAARHFVAVTGDGVNDAPALRAANIGVAMGKGGTDVAREAADLVLSDDNFASIVAGIEAGRVAYANIRKVVLLLVTTGVAEVIAAGCAVVAGLPLPLLPAQLLWLNLVTNGVQHVGLVFEPGEGDELNQRPRPTGESLFNRSMLLNMAFASVLMGGAAFAAFRSLLNDGVPEAEARNVILLLMVLFENVYLGSCRSERRGVLGLNPLRSPLLLAGAAGALLLHVGAMYSPLGQRVLGAHPVSLGTWVTLGGMALGVFALVEAFKLLVVRRLNR